MDKWLMAILYDTVSLSVYPILMGIDLHIVLIFLVSTHFYYNVVTSN